MVLSPGAVDQTDASAGVTGKVNHAIFGGYREHSALPILRLITVMSILAVAAGCAHWYKADETLDPLDAWLGWRDRALVMRWGAPDELYEMKGGNRILTWRRSRSEQQGGALYTATETRFVDGRKVLVPITRQKPAVTVRLHCTTNIEIDDKGYVVDFDYSGNDCGDYPAPPE